MPPKKRKKTAPKKAAKKKEEEKPVIPPIAIPAVVPVAPPVRAARPGKACICIQNNEGWFCMQRLPNGELKECDGPFETKEECEDHECR